MKMTSITAEFIRELMSKGMRETGRGLMDYRPIKINLNTMPNAEGSAEVLLGNTRVLTGIKLATSEPLRDKPNEGDLRTAAELLPLAHQNYEPGPASPESIELARVVDRGIRAAKMIDTTKLFIEEGKVWSVFVDIYILNFDGNLFDACMLSSVAALRNTRMPKFEDGKEIHEGKLPKLAIGNTATSCTFAKVGDKIILDPDGNEELAVADARITISNDEKAVRAMQKGLRGSFTFREVDRLVETTFEKSKGLRSAIDKASGE